MLNDEIKLMLNFPAMPA